MTNYSTTSRWGFRYPSDTPTPNVISDFATLMAAMAGDIDALPLSLKAAATSGASATAVDGQMLNCTGAACTVTLPASAKGLLGVRAGGTQSGTAQVTIAAAGGALIKGKGHSAGASSIALGTPGAAVVLLWDGSNWLVVSGQQDTGWVPLALNTGTTAFTNTYTPAARIQGDKVELRGGVQNTSGGTWGANTVFTNLPSSAFEAAKQIMILGSYASGAINLYSQFPATTSLLIQQAVTNNDVVRLDDASYPLVV